MKFKGIFTALLTPFNQNNQINEKALADLVAFNLRMGVNRKRVGYYQELLSQLNLGLEDKLNVKVGSLSGGQRQRLAIARALLKDSRVLMLDEATSALDNMTQAKIQQAIANIRGDKTVITIAHRLSTVVHADRIMVIEQGRVLDQGTHRELLDRCPTYRKLYEAESGAA